MIIDISTDTEALGTKAGQKAAESIAEAIREKGQANIIVATGTSQFATLNQLIRGHEIDWSKVVLFHLDEYIGLPLAHPASFRKYLQERVLSQLPALKAAYLVDGEAEPGIECKRLAELITRHPIDVALVGIGENAHLAFNDPPADFETDEPYIIVNLDEACRKQQLGEGWFSSLDEVPAQAISMSVRQIMKSRRIICSVPDSRKAAAVKDSLERDITNWYPATILQSHPDCSFYLDNKSSSLLRRSTIIGEF